jgi:hypothetical protein
MKTGRGVEEPAGGADWSIVIVKEDFAGGREETQRTEGRMDHIRPYDSSDRIILRQ